MNPNSESRFRIQIQNLDSEFIFLSSYEFFRTQCTPKNIDAVKAAINQKGMPVRRVAAGLGMEKDSVHRILKKDLGFYHYKLQILQELKENDSEKQVVFAEEQLEHMEHDQNLFEAIGF
uniref:Uncharacterized protein n=1 Tax=Acrobeloides nanus TaxID=290746 RepID=A0A914EBP7_9BILA